MRNLIRLIVCLLIVVGNISLVNANNGIGIYTENPRYWSWDGQPTLLIGGSVEDNLFQIAGLEAHLDLLVESGGNYVRNTMSSRDPGDIWPFRKEYGRVGRLARDEPWWARFTGRVSSLLPYSVGVYPRYDLNEENPEYWRRFEALLRLASERGIVVQIELWDRFDYARDPWLLNPYNPANNVNYTERESGLESRYPEHPGRNHNPFFRSIPELEDNALLLGYQLKQVDRMLSISLRHDNVLYTISNETNGDPAWSAYWARHIRTRAAEQGVTVYLTEMWDARDLSDPMHNHTFDHPELYDYMDVSQNNHQVGQQHWDNLYRQWQRVAERPRPLNNVKIYGADGGRFATTDDAVERFWRSLLGGAGSVRFHRPEQNFGLGLGALAQKQIRSARMLSAELNWMAMEPRLDLLSDLDANEAFLMAEPGRQYLLFFTGGGEVTLRASGEGPLRGRWLRPDTAQWAGESRFAAGSEIRISAPTDGRWLLMLKTDSL
ncbi:MAG: hypothetical protein WD057_03780 [Aquisalimonadaceae bacterium]